MVTMIPRDPMTTPVPSPAAGELSKRLPMLAGPVLIETTAGATAATMPGHLGRRGAAAHRHPR